MAAIVTAWNSIETMAVAMQNAVPNTFSKVEIAESGDYTGQLVAYDDDNNICFRLIARGNFVLCFRDGSTLAITNNWNINNIAVCANGVILNRDTKAGIIIAKDHRGKIAFATAVGPDVGFDQYNTYDGDSSTYTLYTYGVGQSTDQTNLCHMMVPKAGTDTNYFEHGYISEQYNLNTSPLVCQIAGHTCVSCYRVYLMDD